MHAILKQDRFKDWYLNKMISFYRDSTGIGPEEAKVKLKDSLNQEINQLSFVIENFYPHSRPDNANGYLFITNPIEHFSFEASDPAYGMWYPGRATISFPKISPRISFDDPDFIHGHINHSNSAIKCWGGYRESFHVASTDGFAAALAELHLFVSKSRYGTGHRAGKTPAPARA